MSARGWIWGAGVGFALIVAGASLSMRVMLDASGAAEAGLSARAVSGTVWDGVLHDVRVGALPLGTVEARLSPLALLRGEAAMAFARQDAALGALNGQIVGGSAAGVRDVSGALALGARMGALSVGQAQLAGVSLRFDRDGRCVEAGGTVTAALAAPVAGLNLAQGLAGPLACSGGRAVAALASQSGMETLRLSFGAGGDWQARFKVATSSDPALVSGLAAMGFQTVGDGYVLSLSGK
jgi:general secretion pathway protein N